MTAEDAADDTTKKLLDGLSKWGGIDKRTLPAEVPDLKQELVAWELTSQQLAVAIVRLLDSGWVISNNHSDWYY